MIILLMTVKFEGIEHLFAMLRLLWYTVIVKNGVARLEDNTLAGSVLTLNKSIKNVYENTNYPLYEIIKMASYNGAKFCKVDNRKGQIKENFDADLVIFDNKIDIKMTIIGGKIVYNNL